jgi:hypothetical protein
MKPRRCAPTPKAAAEYAARIAGAEKDAAAMVEHAKHEAEAIIAKAESDTTAVIARREKMAWDKIEAAERGAVAELRQDGGGRCCCRSRSDRWPLWRGCGQGAGRRGDRRSLIRSSALVESPASAGLLRLEPGMAKRCAWQRL